MGHWLGLENAVQGIDQGVDIGHARRAIAEPRVVVQFLEVGDLQKPTPEPRVRRAQVDPPVGALECLVGGVQGMARAHWAWREARR